MLFVQVKQTGRVIHTLRPIPVTGFNPVTSDGFARRFLLSYSPRHEIAASPPFPLEASVTAHQRSIPTRPQPSPVRRLTRHFSRYLAAPQTCSSLYKLSTSGEGKSYN